MENIDEVRRALTEAGWIASFVPSHELGSGGGGVVYKCFRGDLVTSVMERVRLARVQISGDDAHTIESTIALIDGLDKHLVRDQDAVGAVKIATSADYLFPREIKAMKTVCHPNLIKIYDHDARENPAWVVMEYLPGGILANAMGRYSDQPATVLDKLLDLVSAVEALDRAGLVHRDIKPKNIFVGRDGRWILADLGVACEHGAERDTAAGADSPLSRDWFPRSWMIEDEPYDVRFDLFMLARVALCLIHGEKIQDISWLTRPKYDLTRRLAGLPGVDQLQRFFLDHLVVNREDFQSRSIAEFRNRINLVLRSLRGGRDRLLFSLWEPVGVRSTKVNGVPIRISEPATRLVGRAVASRNVEVSFQIADESGAKVRESTRARTGDVDTRHWTEEILMTEPLAPGWYRLNLRVESSGSGHVEGFTLHAE